MDVPTPKRIPAATTLTTALTICSKIWDTAVGTMVPVPWKYPLSTPRYAMIQMVGARVFNAYRLKGVLMSSANKSAPNHRTNAAMPPTAVA